MEENLKRVVTTTFGTIAFMFVAFSAIAIFSSGKIIGITTDVAKEPATESPMPGLAAGSETDATLGEDTLAAVIDKPHDRIPTP